jgi:hypothetical protein
MKMTYLTKKMNAVLHAFHLIKLIKKFINNVRNHWIYYYLVPRFMAMELRKI